MSPTLFNYLRQHPQAAWGFPSDWKTIDIHRSMMADKKYSIYNLPRVQAQMAKDYDDMLKNPSCWS